MLFIINYRQIQWFGIKCHPDSVSQDLPFYWEQNSKTNYIKVPGMMNVVLRRDVHVSRHVWRFSSWVSNPVLLIARALPGSSLNLAFISRLYLHLYRSLSGSSQWEHLEWNNSLLIGLWPVRLWWDTSVDRWGVLFSRHLPSGSHSLHCGKVTRGMSI